MVGGGFGAGGAADALQQIIKEKFLELQQRQLMQRHQQSLSEDARQADLSHALGQRNAAVSEGNLGVRRDEFGQDVRAYNEAAPTRAANLRLTGAQTENLNREPIEAADRRAHDMMLETARSANDLKEIGARGAEDRRTLGARPAGGTGEFTTVQQGIGPDGKPALMIVDRRSGTATPVQMPGGYTPNRPARPVTGQERKELAFFQRMLEAERNARKVEGAIGHWDSNVSSMAPQAIENWLLSEQGQRYVQAQRAYTEGRLRADSGAAVPQGEYDTDRKMNFRVAGDKDVTLKQKRGTRITALRAQGSRAGRALQEQYGEDADLDALLKEFEEAAATGGGANVDALRSKYGY